LLGSNKRLRPKFAPQPIDEIAGGGSLCWLALAPFGLVEAVGAAAFSISFDGGKRSSGLSFGFWIRTVTPPPESQRKYGASK
jgi:hypothetical protein